MMEDCMSIIVYAIRANEKEMYPPAHHKVKVEVFHTQSIC